MSTSSVPPGQSGGDRQLWEFWGNTLLAADGAFLLGLSIIVTILGTQMYYRLRGQPVNNSVAGLVMGMCTGAVVFSDLTYDLFGNLPHRVIRLDSQVFYSLLLPPIVFYAGFSVKKKLFFKNLVTIAIFGILGCNLTAYLLSMGIYPILESTQIYSLPSGPNSTAQAITAPSLLPTPWAWEASFATLAAPTSGSAHVHAFNGSQNHKVSQFESVSQNTRSDGTHRRNLASSAQDAPQQTSSVNKYRSDASQRMSELSESSEGDSGNSAAAQSGTSQLHFSSSPQQPADDVGVGEAKGALQKKLLSASMRLGTVFSPTDNLAILHYLSPHTQPVLHSLLFGEGVMNDITAVIMLKTTATVQEVTWNAVVWSYWKFITLFSASSAMGVSAGLLSALLTKHFFSDSHHHTDREVILMTTMAATSYVGAVLAGLSGIVAVFFCGITMSHYTWHNISASARVMSVHNFRVLCSLSEVYLFIYAGLDTSAKLTARFGHPEDRVFLWAVIQLALAMVVLVAVVRALFVALAVAIVNLWRSYKFTMREAVIMWYGGLVRGSVTTALAYSYLYTEERNEPGDEAVLLASVLVVVVSTVIVGGLSQEFMSCVTLPPAQSRLIEINLLPGMNQEDDTSVNSAAVLSSKLHKLWRRFDKNVLQALFGGRDARMPTYFQSVAELNQRIMRVQNEHGDVPVPPMVPRHMPQHYSVLSSPASTDMSSVHTADFQGSYAHSLHSQEGDIDGEGVQYQDCSGTPSPLHSSNDISDLQAEVLGMLPPNVSSDRVTNRLSQARHCSQQSGLFSNCPSTGATEVTELPTTTSVIQQMEGISDQSILRSHSDPHMQHAIPSLPRSTSASSSNHNFRNHHRSDSQSSINTHNQASSFSNSLNPAASLHGVKKWPSGGSSGLHSISGDPRPMQKRSLPEAWGVHRVQVRPATPSVDIQNPPVASSSASGEQNGYSVSPVLCANDPDASVVSEACQERVASSSPSFPPIAAAAAATPSPALPVSTVAMEADLATKPSPTFSTAEKSNSRPAEVSSLAHRVTQAVPEHDRVAQALRDGFLGAAGAIATAASGDRGRGDGESAVLQPGCANSGHLERDKPPAGPSAALARLVKGSAAAGQHQHGPSSVRSEGVTSQTSERTTGVTCMVWNGSRGLPADGAMSTAQSMVADNLPEPYQPPDSNATSEDVHVGLENQYSTYEDALLDGKHGGEDMDIPWDAYDEEDKRAAAGCRSAMSGSYTRH